jgi:hypothetical protein
MTAALAGSSSAAWHTLPTATAARPGASVALGRAGSAPSPTAQAGQIRQGRCGREPSLPTPRAAQTRRDGSPFRPASCSAATRVPPFGAPSAYCAQAADKTAASSLLRTDGIGSSLRPSLPPPPITPPPRRRETGPPPLPIPSLLSLPELIDPGLNCLRLLLCLLCCGLGERGPLPHGISLRREPVGPDELVALGAAACWPNLALRQPARQPSAGHSPEQPAPGHGKG